MKTGGGTPPDPAWGKMSQAHPEVFWQFIAMSRLGGRLSDTPFAMALIFECIQTPGIAELSYLLGDDGEGVAAVFDPRPDVDCYLELARQKQLAITHVFETHIHADLVSGARELCARVDSATIFVSHEGGAHYGFDHEAIKDGDIFKLGSVRVTVRHTPGHTPEHVAYLLAEDDHPDAPWGVLSGDSLFVSSAGPRNKKVTS